MPRRSTWGSNQQGKTPGTRRLRYWADLHDGRGYMRHTMTIAGTRKDGDRRLAELRLAHDADAPTPTVSEAHAAWWVPWAERRVGTGAMTAGSRRQFESIWRKHVEPRWGSTRVGDVRPAAVQEWLLSMPHSAASHSKIVLSRILERARFHEATDNDPFTGKTYEMRPKSETARVPDAYSADELRRLWVKMWGQPCEAAFLLAAFGSARVGESLGVRAAEVRFGECEGVSVAVVKIVRQVSNMGGVVVGHLKTHFSERPVVLLGPAAERLRDLAVAALGIGEEWLCDDGLGEPMGQRALMAELAAAAKRAGLRRLAPQTLRPSWQTIAQWTLRIDRESRERMMGHSVGGVTGAHYDRATTAQLVEIAAAAYAANPFMDGWNMQDEAGGCESVGTIWDTK